MSACSAGSTRGAFVSDIVNGDLSRDLNDYRGFIPRSELKAEGLASPNWGKLFKLYKRDDGTFHGVYVGAGPYISAMTDLNIDNELIDILSSPTRVEIPNRNFLITDTSDGQLALAITGGYRGRIAFSSKTGTPGRNGIYIGAVGSVFKNILNMSVWSVCSSL